MGRAGEPTGRHRGSRMRFGLVVLWLVAGCGGEPVTAPVQAPLPVVVMPALQRDVPVEAEWVGTVTGSVNARISARVQGYVEARNYVEGATVEVDDLLFTIDDRPYRAGLEEAEGLLARAEAALTKTRLDVARFKPLAREGAISQQELDNAVQANRANEGQMRQARAAVEQARLNLSWTKVRSPIQGVAGLALVSVGDLIGADTPLTTVSTLDPLRVEFAIAEQDYLRLAGRRQEAIRRGEETPSVDLRLVLADGSLHPYPSTGLVVDREVDVHTGTLRLLADFPNPTGLVRPGQFARVRGLTDLHRNAVVVPQRAVFETQGIAQVAVVGADGTVEVRRVAPGERLGSLWRIAEGLEPGELVIVEGVQKVRPGAKVAPSTAPTPSPVPTSVAG